MPTGLRRDHHTGDLHAINFNRFSKRPIFRSHIIWKGRVSDPVINRPRRRRFLSAEGRSAGAAGTAFLP